MNLKLAKRLRRTVNEQTRPYGLDVSYREYAMLAVSGRKAGDLKNTETGEILKRRSIQIRMKLGCPRQIYKGLKDHVKGRNAR